MAKEMNLTEIISLDNLVSLGKREGLKYFKKANEHFSVQDLCKHWQISSATFYSKYAPQIGYKTKSRSKLKTKENIANSLINTKKMDKINTGKKDKLSNIKTKELIENDIDKVTVPVVSMKGIPKIFEEKTNASILGKSVTTMALNDDEDTKCFALNSTEGNKEQISDSSMKMEHFFKMNNCSDLNKMKEIFDTVNGLFNQSSVFDVELKMIEK